MNVNVEYKVFENIKELHRYLEGVYNKKLSGSYLNLNYFWKRANLNNNEIIYNISTVDTSKYISKSKIGYFEIPEKIIYFYVGDNKVYTINIKNDNWLNFENKLYHLTHGPKALSIPEAFRILAL